MRKNENKKDNLFLTNAINVSVQHSKDFRLVRHLK